MDRRIDRPVGEEVEAGPPLRIVMMSSRTPAMDRASRVAQSTVAVSSGLPPNSRGLGMLMAGASPCRARTGHARVASYGSPVPGRTTPMVLAGAPTQPARAEGRSRPGPGSPGVGRLARCRRRPGLNAENMLEIEDAALADRLAAYVDSVRARYPRFVLEQPVLG